MTHDIAANRGAVKWTKAELLGRALWGLASPLFRCSPRMLWGWRCGLLRVFGAKVGRAVHVHATTRIAIPWNLAIGDYSSIGDRAVVYNLGPLEIGSGVTVSQGAHLCGGTHDYRRPDLPLVKAPIRIEDGAWVCADAFVGPGVTIGSHAIVAARAVAVRDAPPWTIVAGNPARAVKPRPSFEHENESLDTPAHV